MLDQKDWSEPPQGSVLKSTLRNLLLVVLACGAAAWALSYRDGTSDSLWSWLPQDEPARAAAQPPASLQDDPELAEFNDEALDYDAAMAEDPEAADFEGEDAGYNREVAVRRAANGHFFLHAMVNGVQIDFLIDTGASDIVLTPDDAKRLRFNRSSLDYSLSYETANGSVRAAPVTLREFRVGQLELYDLDAAVNEAAMNVSLLGMSFLERLSGYRVEGQRMVLEW